MNKKILLIVPAIAIAAVLTAGIVQAYSGFGFGHKNIDSATAAQNFENKLSQEADLLGITVEEMKTFWSQGKSIKDIANEKGITQDQLKAKMQAQRATEQKQWLQNLVDQGKLTQAQADSRLQTMQTKAASMKDKKANRRGFRSMFDKNSNLNPVAN